MFKRYGTPEKLIIAEDVKCESCGKVGPVFTTVVNGKAKKLCSECASNLHADKSSTKGN